MFGSTVTQSALAQSSDFRLELNAPAACIDAATFRTHLASRTANAKYEAPKRIVVRIDESDSSFVGLVSITHRDESITERVVRASRCGDVAEALELVTAVALGLNDPPSKPPPTEEVIAPPVDETKPPVVANSSGGRWRVSAAAYAGLTSGIGPAWTFAPSVALGVRHESTSVFAPAVEVSGAWAPGASIATSQGSASLTRLDAALAACPVRFSVTSSFGIRPCAEFRLGTLTANGSGPTLVGGDESSRPWAAAGAFARVEWYATSSLRLDIQAGAALPLAKQRFYFTPNTTIAETPAVAGTLAVGGAFAWP